MTARKSPPHPAPRAVERVQTGVRLEKRLVKVLKGLAEYLDLSLGDLLEGIALHALENKPPFKRATLEKIAQLRRVYGFDLLAADAHRLREQDAAGG
jgi:predicted DNA-binding ribbon-helix-helix protein